MLVACSLLAVAGPAAAQSPAPQPPATPASQPPERKPAGEPTLNLKLDDSSRRQIMSGSTEESGSGAGLPSLGGDARSFGDPGARDRIPASTPFPKDTSREYGR